MSADFFSVAFAVDPAVAKRELPELTRLETTHKDNVYLDCGPDALEVLGALDDGKFVMSPNYPVFVAIDRFGCDRALLDGRAFLHVVNAGLVGWRGKWTAIRKRPDLVENVFARLDRGGGSDTVITEALAAIDRALVDAVTNKRDLVLVSVLA